MPLDTILDEDDFSSEEEDSDFSPDAAPGDGEADFDSDSDADDADAQQPKNVSKSAKRRKGDDEAEDAGFENSGDEAIITKGVKRRRKKGALSDDEGGEGGLIKTRSMRATEKAERKPLLSTAAATVDVDSLWADMMSKPIRPEPEKEKVVEAADSAQGINDATPGEPPKDKEQSDTITIKRTYNFAGKVHVEEKVVPRDSAEAKLWLESQGEDAQEQDDDSKPRRPLKRLQRSRFEPIPIDPPPPRTDLNFAVAAIVARAAQIPINAKKLNTVEKSRMDWAGYVDKAGIKDELAVAGKAKGSFMAQQDFLARVENKKEEEARQARLARLNA